MDRKIEMAISIRHGTTKDFLDVSLFEVLGPSRTQDVLTIEGIDVKNGLDVITSTLKALLLK